MNVRCISRSKYLLTRKQGNESRGEGTWVYLIMCKILRYSPTNVLKIEDMTSMIHVKSGD